MPNARLYHLSRSTYVCMYHIVWTPKYRGKVLSDTFIKQELKRIFKMIAKWKGFVIDAWHVGDEHIHLHLTIPPKYSVAYAVAILKGKSLRMDQEKDEEVPPRHPLEPRLLRVHRGTE